MCFPTRIDLHPRALRLALAVSTMRVEVLQGLADRARLDRETALGARRARLLAPPLGLRGQLDARADDLGAARDDVREDRERRKLGVGVRLECAPGFLGTHGVVDVVDLAVPAGIIGCWADEDFAGTAACVSAQLGGAAARQDQRLLHWRWRVDEVLDRDGGAAPVGTAPGTLLVRHAEQVLAELAA